MSYKEEIKNFSYKIHNSAIELDPFKENGFVIEYRNSIDGFLR